MMDPTAAFTAIILAGKRPGLDPVAEAAGVACKSFAPVGGRPMVHRVLDALADSRQVGQRILCGPSESLILQEPELKARLQSGEIKWIDSHPTPSLSTYRALQAFPARKPMLVTTADHAMLTPQVVDYFCDESSRLSCDLAVGLTAYDSQKIRAMAVAGFADEEVEKKSAVMGALALYLDFINLFLLLLRVLGSRND